MIELEDGLNYFVTAEIKDGDIIYVYLTNTKDVTDFCVRKTDETKEELVNLDSGEEFKKAMELFEKKAVE